MTRMRCGVISIQFEGTWLPLTGALQLFRVYLTCNVCSFTSHSTGLGIRKLRRVNMLFGRIVVYADVSTDVVGKYCYYLDMPLEDRRVPVIVDVALIGRTKIIKLHSAFWIQVRRVTRPSSHSICCTTML